MYRTVSIAALAIVTVLCVAVPSVAHARDVNNARIVAVHSGETNAAHEGAACFFKDSQEQRWIRVPNGPAGEINCSIATAAFLANRSISYDLTAPGSSEIRFLCMGEDC